jgi:branched-chain amino acid aminotransferase
MPVVEKNFEAYDVYTADEAFMTGTPFCMLPVTSLNGNDIGTGKVGETFSRLLGQWSANTGVDVAGQIKQWDRERAGSTVGDAPTPYRFKSK